MASLDEWVQFDVDPHKTGFGAVRYVLFNLGLGLIELE